MFASEVHEFVAFCSQDRLREIPAGVEVVLSPYRHEVPNKLSWLPRLEADTALDAILYPYWPSPPWRRQPAPPAVVIVHDLAFRLRPDEVPWQQRLYLGSLLPRALASAAAVITPSQVTRQDLLESYPLPGLAERLRVVPEGPTPLPDAGRLPEGLEPGYLLAVGTLEERKNYPRLLEAYARLEPAPPLVIAGKPGWNGFRLPEQKGVLQLGHVSDATLRALYENAALLAFPSLYEGFGIPLLDAMSRGLPALIGDRSALPEVAGEAALAVDPTDVGAIADGLRRLLGDGALRKRLAAAGRRRARAFTWERAAELTIALLVEVAGSPRMRK